MTAREMFEKLGYDYSCSSDNDLLQPKISYFIDKPNEKGHNFYEIRFWLEDKDYEIANNSILTIEELQAINKQVEELGWSFTATPKEPTRKTDWEVTLYNKDGNTVLETNNYEDLMNFLGRSRGTVVAFIYRARRGLVRRVSDIYGNTYTYSLKEF